MQHAPYGQYKDKLTHELYTIVNLDQSINETIYNNVSVLYRKAMNALTLVAGSCCS